MKRDRQIEWLAILTCRFSARSLKINGHWTLSHCYCVCLCIVLWQRFFCVFD